jgi:hypothetical protein
MEAGNIVMWIVLWAVSSLFWVWICWWDGAEWLEGKALSGCLVHWLAPRWSADGIRLFGWLALVIGTVWFVIGLFSRDVRVHFW